MIRVLLLIPTLDRSGAEKQLTLLASGLPRNEFAVEVVALTRGGPYADALTEHGVPVTIIGKKWKFDPFAYRRLKEFVAEKQPDILHTWLFAANAYGRLLVGQADRPKVVVSERCVDTWKKDWQLWFDRRLIDRTAKLVGNSQAVIDFYRGLGVPADRTVVIRNGIEPPPEAVRSRESLLAEFNIPATARVVTYVGRLAAQKRVQDLLWAFALLRNCADQEVYFLIVGDGPERAADERFSQKIGYHDYVRFVGHRSDVSDVLRASDVFWLASEFEGQSNSLMEAMSLGLPVVVSDIAANRELVEHEVTGLVVPMGDRPAYTHATWRLLSNPEHAQRFGRAAAEKMRTEFSVDRMIAEHAAMYRDVMQRPN